MNLPKLTLALFCRVIDNFGDIGVCWRLAQQLQREYAIEVSLWVDDLASFQKICPQVQTHLLDQRIQQIKILHWRDDLPIFADRSAVAGVSALAEAVPDVVIEGFGCTLPHAYLMAMKQRSKAPIWLNLEYLSAETWVDDCHGLPSPHAQTGLKKYFYFPGFTEKTGGVLAEGDLHQRRLAFQSDPGKLAQYWQNLGLGDLGQKLKISMFCYPHAPVAEMFALWQAGEQEILCLVPQGVAHSTVHAFLQQDAIPGARKSQGALTVQVLPFVTQAQYDELLWACDINFVRGEDSFVRAQLAARPFVWQIYPQDEGVHLEKLQAFMQRYFASDRGANECGQAFWLDWNARHPAEKPQGTSTSSLAQSWASFLQNQSQSQAHAFDWARMLAKNGDLAARLMQFIQKIG